MTPILTDGVAWSVGLSVTIVNPAKTAEPIDTPFGLWTQGGKKAFIMPAGCTLAPSANTTEPCAVVMRPFVKCSSLKLSIE